MSDGRGAAGAESRWDEGDSGAPRPTQEPSVNVAHSEAGIFSILSQYAVMQVVLAFTGVIRNKVVAFRLGPTAFGEIAQIAAVTAVMVTLVTFGMGVSLSRNAAKCRTLEERQEQLSNANGMVLCFSCVAVLGSLLFLASGRLLTLVGLRQEPTMVLAAVLFIAAVPFEGLRNNYLALLQGILDVKGLAIGRSVAVLLATVIAVPVVWIFGFVGAAIQFFLLSVFVTVLLGWRCRSIGYAPLRLRLDRSKILLLASFGIVSLVSGFGQGLADTAVRTSLIERAGATANGLLQAPYMLAVTVKGIVLASIGSVSLATIAPKTDRKEISDAVDRLLNVVIPIGTAALGLLGLLGVPAMILLYSKAFTSSAIFFPYVLSADLLLVFVWVIGAPLLAKGDRVLWLLLDLFHAAARWGLALLLMRRLGSYAVVVGYLIAVAVHVSLNLAIYRFRYRLQLSPKHVSRVLFGLALVGLLSLAGARPTASLLATSAAAMSWLAFVLYHARHGGLLVAVQRRLQRR